MWAGYDVIVAQAAWLCSGNRWGLLLQLLYAKVLENWWNCKLYAVH